MKKHTVKTKSFLCSRSPVSPQETTEVIGFITFFLKCFIHVKTCYYCAISHPKLSDIKRQPFYYAHQFCDSEIHQGYSKGDLPLLHDAQILSSKDSGIIWRLIYRHVWSLHWVDVKTEIDEQSTWTWLLHVVRLPHSMVASYMVPLESGLSLLVNKEQTASPFWLSL